MKQVLSKYAEIILIILTAAFLMLKPLMPEYGERISMIMFATLSFYYLASGFLVFLDKYRITRIMRLMYMAGLWAVSLMVIAVMARTLLLHMNEDLLLICISSAAGILLFSRIYFERIEHAEDKKLFATQIKPLTIRCISALIIGIAFYFLPPYSVYYTFGTHRNDPVYIDKIVNVYNNPQDTVLLMDLQHYENTLHDQAHSATEAP